MSLSYFVRQIFNIVYLVLLIYILLSWIPKIDWARQPFLGIRKFADIIFAPFRSIIPPIGGMIDVSPIIAFLFLEIVENLVLWILGNFGL